MRRQFEQRASKEWDFICLTDRPSEDWHLPLRTNWPGWWGILESFRLTCQPHVLTGLDTLLYGDVRPILRLAEDCPPSVLYGIRDLGKPARWASGVTVWNGDWSFLAERFDPVAHPRLFRGNQEYTAWAVGREPGRHLCYLPDKVDGIVSYKYHLRGRHTKPPAGTRIVCFHGKPRPWNVKADEAAWVVEFLEEHDRAAGECPPEAGCDAEDAPVCPKPDFDAWEQARRLGVTHVPVAAHSPNLGDDIQAETACRWFGVRETVPRDHPGAWPEGSCVALCGWWAGTFLPPQGVRVVLIGMHWDPRCWRRMQEADWRRLRELVARQGFPLGCRDAETLAVARRHGVEAVFSGCVTQTLRPPWNGRRAGRYAVDCAPPGETWASLTHRVENLSAMTIPERLALASERLELYARAEAVMTSRLHAFLPARALGVPSVEWRFDKPPGNVTRLSGHCPEFTPVPGAQPRLPPPHQKTRNIQLKVMNRASSPEKPPMNPHPSPHSPCLNVLDWERDRERVLSAFNGGAVDGSLRLRAWHSGGMVELRSLTAANDLDDALRRNGVNLDRPFDLEIFTARKDGFLHRRGGRDAEVMEAMNEEGAALPAQLEEARTEAAVAVTDNPLPSEVPVETARPVRLAPMFFRADGGTVDLADLYRGQTLFLVLNGASLKDFDWERLRRPGICSFGVNNGAHGFRSQFWTCVDDPTRFLETIWRDPGVLKFVPQGHFDKPVWDAERDRLSAWKVRDFPNVIGYRRNERFQAAQWLHEDTFNWGNHAQYGGGRSVMLVALRMAYLLGFRRVHLLGCDFQMDEQRRYWFDEERTPAAIRNNTNSYRILTGYFEQLKPHFDRAGFQVFNCNPESHLKVFPFADLDRALREAEVRVSAGTRGMYVDRYKSALPSKEECREFLEPLLAAVTAAEVCKEPFVHIRLAGVFPEAVYRALLAHLPQDASYHELRHDDAIQPDGKSARLRFSFGDKEMAALPPEQRAFWQRVLLALRDPALEQAFREKLKTGLHERFRDSLSEIVLRPVPELVRDLAGYRIGAHTGIFKKVITTQIYLPEDDSQELPGTSFFRRNGSGGFDPALRMPFHPATGHAFAVSARSWHGVDPVPDQPRPRNSLLLTYYLAKPGA